MSGCSPEFLNNLKEFLDSKGLTPETKNMLEKVFGESNLNSDVFKRVIDNNNADTKFTEFDQDRFNQLIEKAQTGFNKDKGLSGTLSKFEIAELVTLQRKFDTIEAGGIFRDYKSRTIRALATLRQRLQKATTTGERAKIKNYIALIERTENAKKNRGIDYDAAKELSNVLKQNDTLKSIFVSLGRKKHSKHGKEYENTLNKIKSLQDRIDKLDESIEKAETFFKENFPDNADRKIKESDSLRKNKQKRRSLIEDIKNLRQRKSKLENQISLEPDSDFQSLLDSVEMNTAKVKRQFRKLAKRMPTMLRRLEDMDPNLISARAIQEAAKRIKKQIKWTKEVVEEIKNEDGSLNLSDAQWIFGDQLLINVLGDITFTELGSDQVEAVLSYFISVMSENAVVNPSRISKLNMPDKESFMEMRAMMSGQAVVDNHSNDEVYVPARTIDEQMEEAERRGWELGVTPDNLKFTDSKEAYEALTALRSRIAYLEELPQFQGEGVSLALIDSALQMSDKLAHFSARRLFADALEWDTPESYVDDGVEQLQEFKRLMNTLGMTQEEIANMPEIKNREEWLRDPDKIVSFDLETRGNFNIIMAVVHQHNSKPEILENKIGEEAAKEFTPDTIIRVLDQLESYQNNGFKIVGHNTVNSDFKWMRESLETIADPKERTAAIQKLSRVMFRSFDMLLSIRTNADGRMVSLDNLSRAAQEGTQNPEYKSEEITGKNIGDEWTYVNENPDAEDTSIRNDVVRKYVEQDGKATTATFRALIEKLNGSDPHINVKFNRGRSKPSVEGSSSSADNLEIRNLTLDTVWKTSLSNKARRADMNPRNILQAHANNPVLKDSIQLLQTGSETGLTDKSRLRVNLRKVQRKLQRLSIAALASDPDANNITLKMLDKARKSVDSVTIGRLELAESLAQQHLNGMKPVLAKMKEANQNRLILSYDSTGQPDLVTGSPEAQLETWEKTTLEYFNMALNDVNSNLQEIVDILNFRDRKQNEKESQYTLAMMNYFVDKYVQKNAKISDLADGTVDYAPATNVGYGIAQIIMGKTGGINHRPDIDAMMDESMIHKATTFREGREMREVIKWQRPSRERIAWHSPRGLPLVQKTWDDFRLRQRLTHIVTEDFSREDLDKFFEELRTPSVDKDGNPIPRRALNLDDVLWSANTPTPGLSPKVNNRRMLSVLPNIDDVRLQTLEMLTGMPQTLLAANHDAVWYGSNEWAFFDPDEVDVFQRAKGMGPGSPTGAMMVAGFGPQLAWMQQYPIVGKAAILDSLERGREVAKTHKTAALNTEVDGTRYLDFKFNGAHHQAAMLLQYDPNTKERVNLLAKIKKELGLDLIKHDSISDQQEWDIYNQTLNNAIKGIELILGSNPRGHGPNVKQALKTSLKIIKDPVGRDWIKKAVIARMYSGGEDAMRENLMRGLADLPPELSELVGRNDVDTLVKKVLIEKIYDAGAFTSIMVIDKGIGLNKKDRDRLAGWLATSVSNNYKSDVPIHMQYKIMADDILAKDREANFQDIKKAFKLRLRMIAEQATPQIDAEDSNQREIRIQKAERVLADKYNKRIENMRKFDESYTGEKNEEYWNKMNTLASGDAEIKTDAETGEEIVVNTAWKENRMIGALNILNSVPREIRTSVINNAVDLHGYNVEQSDLMGFNSEGLNLFAQAVWDNSTGRIYQGMENYAISHQGPSLAKFVGPDSPNGMWKFGQNAFDNMSPEDAKLMVDNLIAKNIMLQIADHYTPELGNYDSSVESIENFYNIAKERSDREDATWNERLLKDERSTDADKNRARDKAGGRLINHERRILDPMIERSTILPPGEYAPTMQLKGVAAFRPMYANIPFDEYGQMSLTTAAYRMRQDEMLTDLAMEVPDMEVGGDVNNIFPQEAAGYVSEFNKEDLPFIPMATVDPMEELIFGLNEHRINNKLKWWRSELGKYAAENGLMDLVEEGNYPRLYTMYKMEKYALDPFLSDMSSDLTQPNVTSDTLIRRRGEYLSTLFQQIQFVYDATDIRINILDIGRNIGIKPEELRDDNNNPLNFLQVLKLLHNKGIVELSVLDSGITLEYNLLEAGGVPGLENRTTVVIPTSVFRNESQMILNMALNNVEMLKAFTSYAKVTKLGGEGPDKDKTLAELMPLTRKDGRYTAVDFSKLDLKYDTVHGEDVLKLHFESVKTLNNVADSLDTYIVLDQYLNGTVAAATRKDTKGKIATEPVAQLGGPPLLRSKITNPDTNLLLTPEHINQLLSALKNNAMMNRIENTALANVELGTVKSNAEELTAMSSEEIYRQQRERVADETDILQMLTEDTNTSLRTVSNTQMRDELGSPLTSYDSIYYMQEEVHNGVTAADEIFVNKARRALIAAERTSSEVFVREEVKTLRQLLSEDLDGLNIDLIKTAVIMSKVSDDPSKQKEALLAYFAGYKLTSNDIDSMMVEASKYAEAINSALVNPEVQNPFFHSAGAVIEKFDANTSEEIMAVASDPKVLSMVGATNDTDVHLVRRALLAQRPSYFTNIELPNYAGELRASEADTLEFMGSEGFENRFGEVGIRINRELADITQIKNDDGNVINPDAPLTEETANFYRGLIGTMMIRTPGIAADLSFVADATIDSVARAMKYDGNKYKISFNKTEMSRRGAADQIRIFAHEMTHIARLKYMRTNSAEWKNLIAVYRTDRGKDAMRRMMSTMRGGLVEGLEAELSYYTDNPDEFLAEWGSYLLINEFFTKKKVLQKLETSNRAIAQATTWWRRAFQKIKNVFTGVQRDFDFIKKSDPEIYNRMFNIVDGLFNFTSTTERMNTVVNNPDQEFNVRMSAMQSPYGKEITEESAIAAAHEFRRANGDQAKQEQILQENPVLMRKVSNNQTELKYLLTIEDIKAKQEGQITYHHLLSQVEKEAIQEYTIRKMANARGLRLDDKKTTAGKLRETSKKLRDLRNSIFVPALRMKNPDLSDDIINTKADTFMQWLVTGSFLPFILPDNQSKYTINAGSHILMALTHIVNHASAITEGSFAQGEGLSDLTQGRTRIRQTTDLFEIAYTGINAKHKKRAALVHQASTDYRLHKDEERLVNLGLSPEEKSDAIELATFYGQLTDDFITMFKNAGFRGGPDAEYDSSNLGIVFERSLLESTKERDMALRDEGIQALRSIMQKKIENRLSYDGNIDPTLMVASGLVSPDLDLNTDNVNEKETKFIIDLLNAKGTNDAMGTMHTLVDALAKQIYVKDNENNPRFVASSWNAQSKENVKIGYYKKALRNMMINAITKKTKWNDLITQAGVSNLDINILFGTQQQHINPTDKNIKEAAHDNLHTAITNGMFNYLGTRPDTKILPRTATNDVIGFYLNDLYNKAGNTMYMPNTNDLGLTVEDIFIPDTPINHTAQRLFSRDLRQIIRNMERSIGFQTVSSNVVKDVTGVNGLHVKALINGIIDRVSGSGSNVIYHRNPKDISSNPDGQQYSPENREILLQGLEVMKRKIDMVGGQASRFNNDENLHPAMQFGIDSLANATVFAWQGNLNLANLTTETATSLLMSALTRTNTVRLFADQIYLMANGLFDLLRPLNRTEAKGVLRTAIQAQHDFDSSARTTGMETDVYEGGGNWIQRRFKGMRRFSQVAAKMTKQSVMRETSRMIESNMDGLYKLRQYIYDPETKENLLDRADLESVKNAAKKAKVKLHPVFIRTLMQSNIFGDRHLEILSYLFKEVPRSGDGPLSTPDMYGMGTHIAQLQSQSFRSNSSVEEVSADMIDIGNGTLVRLEDMRRTVALLAQAQNANVDLSITTSDPLEMSTKPTAVAWLMNIYRSFPLTFSASSLFRHSALLPTHFQLLKITQVMISDLIYNLMLGLLGGWLTYEELERMYKQDKEKFLYTLLNAAARTPVFGRNIGMASQVVNQIFNPEAFGSAATAFEDNIQANFLGGPAIASIYNNYSKAFDDISNGNWESGLARIKRNIMPFGDSAANMLLSIAYPEIAFPENQRSVTNSRSKSAPMAASRELGRQELSFDTLVRAGLEELIPNIKDSYAELYKNRSDITRKPSKRLLDRLEKIQEEYRMPEATGEPTAPPEQSAPAQQAPAPPAPQMPSQAASRATNPIQAPTDLT